MGPTAVALPGGAALVVAAVLAGRRARRSSTEGSSRSVLPAHHSSLVQPDRTRHPGHCPDCGIDNEPGYAFCRACGERLPDAGEFSGPTNVEAVFRD